MELGSQIGKGGYGDVFSGVYNGRPCAIKKQKIEKCGISKHILNEIDIMKRMNNHREFVSIYGIIQNGGYLYIAMELMNENLSTFQKGATLRERLNLLPKLFKFTINVLSLLEENGITHCDVKPHNILLRGGELKLSDFGLSRIYYKEYYSSGGGKYPELYRPPEYITRVRDYDKHKSDVWAFGVVILEFIIGRREIKDALYSMSVDYKNAEEKLSLLISNSIQVKNGTLDGHIDVISTLKRTLSNSEYNGLKKIYRQALVNMLALNPNHRPSGSTIKRLVFNDEFKGKSKWSEYNFGSTHCNQPHTFKNGQIRTILRICRELRCEVATTLLALDLLGRYQYDGGSEDYTLTAVFIAAKRVEGDEKIGAKLRRYGAIESRMNREEYRLLKTVNFNIGSKELYRAIMKCYSGRALESVDFKQPLVSW